MLGAEFLSQVQHLAGMPPDAFADACDGEAARLGLDPDHLAAAVEAARRAKMNGQKHEAQGWKEPDLAFLDTRRTVPPDCPLEVFGSWQGWIKDQAAIASAPVDYVAGALLATAGVMVANSFWSSPWPGWKEPPILFVGCVGLPSSNKSPAIDSVTGPVRNAEKKLAEPFPELHREWQREAATAAAKEAEWKKAVKDAVAAGDPPPDKPDDAEIPPEPKRPRLFTTDATMEAAARLARQEPKGLIVIRDELAGMIGGLDKYGGDGAERAFWIEAYGGRPMVVDRVKFDGKELFVSHLSLAILGGIQPDRLASMILSGDDDGLAARFMLLWPEPVPLRRPQSLPDPQRLTDALVRLRALEPADWQAGEREPVCIRFVEPAAEALHHFRLEVRELEQGASGFFLSHVGKWPGLAVRLALIFELLWWAGSDDPPAGGPSCVSHKAALAAIAFVSDYLHPMAKRVYGEASLPKPERDAGAVARWLKRWLPVEIARAEVEGRPAPDRISVRQVQRERLSGLKTADEVKAAFAELEAGNWLRPVLPEPGRSGRPPGDWLLSPRLREVLR